jgi:hypothetical protein
LDQQLEHRLLGLLLELRASGFLPHLLNGSAFLKAALVVPSKIKLEKEVSQAPFCFPPINRFYMFRVLESYIYL